MNVLQIYGETPENVGSILNGVEKTVAVQLKDMDIPEASGTWDIVFVWHALQMVEANHVPDMLDRMIAKVRKGGELWVIVPSLEWGMQQMMGDAPNPLTQIVMYGPEGNPYRSGFSVKWLRALVDEHPEMVVRKATQDVYTVDIGEGRASQAMQNRIIALKVDNANPADALT